MFLEAGFAFVSARKVKWREKKKSFQKHFSQPTRPWTKTAVNWSRFHFLITFSWGTMARPLPNPGHSRPLTFFPRQLAPPAPRTRGLWGSATVKCGRLICSENFCLLGRVYAAWQNTGRLLMPVRCSSVPFAFLGNKKALCPLEQQIWPGYDSFAGS